MSITGIIMSAGRGSRMKPLTNHTPKPLATISSQNPKFLEYHGKTLLEINMTKMLPLVDKFVIVIHYLGQQIIDFIGDSYGSKPVEYVWATGSATGTLDAFRVGIYGSILSDKSPESNDFLVCNADNICGDEYYQVIQNQIQTDPNCGVLVATQINELEILKTLGVFVVDSNDYLINVAEKSSIFVSNLANIGIYYFPNNIKKLIATTRSPLMDKEETITDLFNLYLGQSPIKIVSGTDVYVAISTEQDLKIN